MAKVADHIPGGERIFILDPTHIVLAFDPAEDDPALLYTVYHLLRAHAAALVLSGTGTALDINALHTTLSGALETLEEFSKIDKAVNSARTQLGNIETTAHRMSDSLHTILRHANEVLEASAT